MPDLKPTSYRIYVTDADRELLQKAAETLELKQTEILSRLASAGLRALAENRNRLTYPLRFRIIDEVVQLSDEPMPKTTYRRGRQSHQPGRS